MEALLEHDVALSEATLLVRSQEDRTKRAAASTPRPTVDGSDEADAAEAAFLDRQFEQAREARTERDRLAEGRRPGTPA